MSDVKIVSEMSTQEELESLNLLQKFLDEVYEKRYWDNKLIKAYDSPDNQVIAAKSIRNSTVKNLTPGRYLKPPVV